MQDQLKFFREHDKLLEAQRIEQRTRYDLEMMQQLGYTNGIENYSRHLSGRPAGKHHRLYLTMYQKMPYLLLMSRM